MGNLAQHLLDTAAEQGRRPALRVGDTVVTYDQFADAARRVAAGLEARFDGAAALSLIERDRVRIFEGVPTMFSRMLHAPDAGSVDVGSLQFGVSGGAAMAVEVMRSFEQTFGCVVLEGYGLTETSPVITFNRPAAGRKVGSIGTPIDGVEVRLVDEHGKEVPDGEVGEIAVRGPNVMKGYWGKPAETAEAIPDGWFRTGDLPGRTSRATCSSSAARRT